MKVSFSAAILSLLIISLPALGEERPERQAPAEQHAVTGLLWGEGELQQTIDRYSAAIAKTPSNADLYLKRGNAFYSQGKKQRAIEDYDKAIALDPTNAESYY